VLGARVDQPCETHLLDPAQALDRAGIEEISDRPVRALELDESMDRIAEHAIFDRRHSAHPSAKVVAMQSREVAIERVDGDVRRADRDRVVVEAPLQLRAREVAADTRFALATIAAMPVRLAAAQPVFAQTGGLHAAALVAATGELLCVREDVGRHNAVDKLAGWTLGAGLDPAATFVFLSGRIGYELVQKAVMLGVPAVAAVSAPSSLAIELAERFNVALVGFVRGARSNVYSHGWRIL
jgi:formate dehydrogenase accessory protein FdhD